MVYDNQREAYGHTLVELGKHNKNIVVLDADLGGSTMGRFFENAYPQRHFEMGIAEANMLSVSAGLACAGKIPFANSFAVFVTGRAFDQIRQTISIGKLNVKIVGSSAGLSDFGDGSTHQSIEDIAIMRAIPNMTVVVPADTNETVQATKAIADYPGPVYLRINRNPYPNVTPADQPFVVGQPTVLKEGSDVVIFATGVTVGMAMEAAQKSSKSVKVVNVSTIKPLDSAKIVELVGSCKYVVTAEEHSIVGGLGGAIAEALHQTSLPIKFLGLKDEFGCSAKNYTELLEHYGITADAIGKLL
ncbi:MAG: transketolase family protein [Defluviitaleaceae bacterium]|nr:transketolase family protein [Defluviitaleaceae bacterium]